MGLITNIKEKWYNIQDKYEQYLSDKKAKKRFPKIIKEVAEDRESIFNQYNVRYSDNYKQEVNHGKSWINLMKTLISFLNI